MRDENKERLSDDFPPNRKTKKVSIEPGEKFGGRKLEKVVTGRVVQQKIGFGKKISGILFEDNTKNVGSYIIHDVLIPAAKSMICDMVGWGGFAEILLFGDKQGNRTRREGGKSYTSYGSYFKNTDHDKPLTRDISRTSRARHDFNEIVLETRGEAEEVLSHLVDLTIDYGMASVADLYDLVGITSNFTDDKYGWTDLHQASVTRVRNGYLIDLPRTQPLDY